MKKFAFFLFMVPAFGIYLTSCSDNDNGGENSGTSQEDSIHVENELMTLQNHLVKVDENGNLVERVWGEVLDAAAPDEVTVGVDNLAEATEIFKGFFADTTTISNDGMHATFSVQEGSAELKASNGENGLIAYAIFNVPGLKYISRINFILNSAWPENAKDTGFHKYGVIYEHKGWTGGPTYLDSNFDKNEYFKYLCIREYSNGKPALLFAICPHSYCLCWRNMENYGGNMPNQGKAKEISNILRKNWTYYKNRINTAYGCTALDEGYKYWIYDGEERVFRVNTYYIVLDNGNIGKYETKNTANKLFTLFYMESCQKM